MDVSPDEPILDVDVIASLKELGGDDDPDLFEEIVQLFLEDAPSKLDDLARALQSGDAAAVETAAHSLKSACGNLGAVAMADLCRRIEAAVRERRLDEVQSLVVRSSDEYERVRRALESEIS